MHKKRRPFRQPKCLVPQYAAKLGRVLGVIMSILVRLLGETPLVLDVMFRGQNKGDILKNRLCTVLVDDRKFSCVAY